GFFALFPVLGSACLLLAGTSGSAISRVLGAAPMAYVGRISYSLYLVHWPLNVFARRWWAEEFTLPWRLGMFAASFLLAAVLYRWVENPFRSRRVLRVNRQLVWAYGSGIALTLSLFVLVEATAGLPQRFPAEVVRIASFTNDRSPVLAACNFGLSSAPGEAGYCPIGVPGKPPRWLVYGDSHAWALHAAFDEWLKARGDAGLLRYLHSCVPLAGVHIFGDGGRCFAFNESVTKFLAGHPEITEVALVSTWRQAPQGRLSTSTDALLTPNESLLLFDEKFAETVRQLNGAGRHVYVWEPVPGGKRDVPEALARAAWTHQPADVEITVDHYRNEAAFFFAALERNRSYITASFSPAATLCRSGMCAVAIDGDPVYFDGSHPGRSSAPFWAGILERAEAEAHPVASAGSER